MKQAECDGMLRWMLILDNGRKVFTWAEDASKAVERAELRGFTVRTVRPATGLGERS